MVYQTLHHGAERVTIDLGPERHPLVEDGDAASALGEMVGDVRRFEAVLLGDQRHVLSHFDGAGERVPALHDVRRSEPRGLGASRLRSGGAGDCIRCEGADASHVGLAAQADVHAVARELAFLEEDEVFEGVAAGRASGEEELTSQLRGAFEKDHLMSTAGCDARGLAACGASARHHETPPGGGDLTLCGVEKLVADLRVHGAGGLAEHLGDVAGDGLGDAAVAANAASDLREATLACLVRELRIGDPRSCHPDEVAVLALQELLRDSGVGHAAGEEDRDALQVDLECPCHIPVDGVAVVGRLDVGGSAPAVPDVDVDEIEGSGFGDAAHHLAQLEQVVAALTSLLAVDADAQREGVSDAFPHGGEDLANEARPIACVATPCVLAVVQGWGQEGLRERLVGAMDLEAVHPGLRELLGGVGVGPDDLRDLVVVELVSDPPVGLDDRHRGGRHREVQLGELTHHHGAGAMDGVTEPRKAFDEAGHLVEGNSDRAAARKELVARLVGERQIQEEGFASDPACSASSLGKVMGDEGLVDEAGHLCGADRVGRLADPVRDGHGTDGKRREEPFEPGFSRGCAAHMTPSGLHGDDRGLTP